MNVNYNSALQTINDLAQEIQTLDQQSRLPPREPGWITATEYAKANDVTFSKAKHVLTRLEEMGQLESRMFAEGNYHVRAFRRKDGTG